MQNKDGQTNKQEDKYSLLFLVYVQYEILD